MGMGDIGKGIDGITSGILKFFDNAYKEGWLIYLIIILVVLFVVLLFQRTTYTPGAVPGIT